MTNTERIIDSCLLAVGSFYSLTNIREVLGIVILIVQLLWLLFKLIAKIGNSLKENKPLEFDDKDVEEFTEYINNLTNEMFKEVDDNESNYKQE